MPEPDGGPADPLPEVADQPLPCHRIQQRAEHLRPHRDRNFVPLDPGERFSVNQDAMVKLLCFAGNMTLSNARLQGVLKA